MVAARTMGVLGISDSRQWWHFSQPHRPRQSTALSRPHFTGTWLAWNAWQSWLLLALLFTIHHQWAVGMSSAVEAVAEPQQEAEPASLLAEDSKPNVDAKLESESDPFEFNSTATAPAAETDNAESESEPQPEPQPDEPEKRDEEPKTESKVFAYGDANDLSDLNDADVRLGFLYAPHAFLGTPDTCIFHYTILGTGPDETGSTNVTVYVSPEGVNCRSGLHDEPQCTVSASKQTMLNILHGHTSVTMCVMCGELSVSDPVRMFSFGNAFKFVREDYWKFKEDFEQHQSEDKNRNASPSGRGVMSDTVLDLSDGNTKENTVVAAAIAAADLERRKIAKKREEATLDPDNVKEWSQLHMGAFVLPF